MGKFKAFCVISLSCSSFAVFACQHPTLPDIPSEGRIGSRAERLIKDDMWRYLTEMSIYVACVQAEYQSVIDHASTLQLSLIATRNNTAVAEVEAMRDIYVERVGPFDEILFEPSSPLTRRPRAGQMSPAQQRGATRIPSMSRIDMEAILQTGADMVIPDTCPNGANC